MDGRSHKILPLCFLISRLSFSNYNDSLLYEIWEERSLGITNMIKWSHGSLPQDEHKIFTSAVPCKNRIVKTNIN